MTALWPPTEDQQGQQYGHSLTPVPVELDRSRGNGAGRQHGLVDQILAQWHQLDRGADHRRSIRIGWRKRCAIRCNGYHTRAADEDRFWLWTGQPDRHDVTIWRRSLPGPSLSVGTMPMGHICVLQRAHRSDGQQSLIRMSTYPLPQEGLIARIYSHMAFPRPLANLRPSPSLESAPMETGMSGSPRLRFPLCSSAYFT